MRRRLLAAIGACSIAAVSIAGPPATPESLVAQLGADFFPDREAAVKALEALGPSAAPALRAACKSNDPETRRRAAAILAKIEQADESIKRIAPKPVSLNFQDVPLGSAVNTLKARTGLKLVLDPHRVADPMRLVTCQTRELPPWEALDEFCKAAGLRELFLPELEVPKATNTGRGYYTPPPPPPPADAVPITLIDGKPESLPGTRSTAVRVLALPSSFPGNRTVLGSGEFTINLDVAPMAGLNWNDVTGVKITRVVDSAGRIGCAATTRETAPSDLDMLNNGVMFLGGGRVAMRWGFDGNPIMPTTHPNPRIVPVLLKVPTVNAASLKLLEGAVVGEVTVPNQHLIVAEHPAKLIGTPQAGPNGVSLVVQDVREAKGTTTMRVTLQTPSMVFRAAKFGFADPLRPTVGPHIRAFNAKGAAITASSSGVTEINDDGVNSTTTYTLVFRDTDKNAPVKLVVIGSKPVAVEVPFRMENVVLP